MLESGKSISWIHKTYGISESLLSVLWVKYRQSGYDGIKRRGKLIVSSEKKQEIIRDIEENHITLPAASLKYGPSCKSIEVWLRKYRRASIDALDSFKNRGGPPCMGRPKKNSRPLTELEKLQKENQELKTEIALLKKVKALVEEREARLREIGLEPSKD